MALPTEQDRNLAIAHGSPDSPQLSSSSGSDLDDNYDLYKRNAGAELDPAKAKRVLRKIDLRVVPVLFVVYLLQYLDKNGINYVSAYGLQKGTNLHGQDYSFGGIATNRFFLGFVEATVNPGFILIMSAWYTSAEQPLRLESYYCTNSIATMFGGRIAGIWTLLFLPGQPSTAKFLTVRERAVAIERVAGNRQGVKDPHFKIYQVWQTLHDPKTWTLFVMAVGVQVPNSAITSFTSLIIKGFGIGTLGTQHLQIPGGAVQFLALLGGGIICSRWPNLRCPTMIVANTICIAGAAMLVGVPNNHKWARLGLGFSLSLTMVSSNFAGYTKKQLTAAILFTGYCVGNTIGPQTFKSSEAPYYHSAYIAMLVGYSVKLAMVVVLYVYVWRANKKRDREAAAEGTLSDDEEKAAIERGMHDVTELKTRASGTRYDVPDGRR